MTNEQAKQKELEYLANIKTLDFRLNYLAGEWLDIDETIKKKSLCESQYKELKERQKKLEQEYFKVKQEQIDLENEYKTFKEKWREALLKLYEKRHKKDAN